VCVCVCLLSLRDPGPLQFQNMTAAALWKQMLALKPNRPKGLTKEWGAAKAAGADVAILDSNVERPTRADDLRNATATNGFLIRWSYWLLCIATSKINGNGVARHRELCSVLRSLAYTCSMQHLPYLRAMAIAKTKDHLRFACAYMTYGINMAGQRANGREPRTAPSAKPSPPSHIACSPLCLSH
jgi:hypothetical protein